MGRICGEMAFADCRVLIIGLSMKTSSTKQMESCTDKIFFVMTGITSAIENKITPEIFIWLINVDSSFTEHLRS